MHVYQSIHNVSSVTVERAKEFNTDSGRPFWRSKIIVSTPNGGLIELTLFSDTEEKLELKE